MKVLFIIVVFVLAAINAASYAIMTYLPKKDTTRGLDIMAVREFVGGGYCHLPDWRNDVATYCDAVRARARDHSERN